jgi:protein-tyrosine phosphatase
MQPNRPDKNSYWVRPGQLLAGEYPGARRKADTRQRIRSFLEAGITFFLDLTEAHELEPYEQILKEEAAARGLAVGYRRMPIKDGGIPRTPQEMTHILDAIDQAIATGQTVYVHCWGGVGRTGTVVGCHLVRQGLAGDEALAELARLWQSMEKRHRRLQSPETPEQAAFVRNWVEFEQLR